MLNKNPSFTYEVIDYNQIGKNSDFLKRLKELTLEPYSVMNCELRNLATISQSRKVKAKIIVAKTIAHNHPINSIVAWALLSNEDSDYYFASSQSKFTKDKGKLFQVYVKESYRRLGIASDIIKLARRHCGKAKICICPWDFKSIRFFTKFNKYQHVKM